MISFVRGRLVEARPPCLVVDVNGIGYELQASMNTFYKLPEPGQEVTLLTQLIVREDAHLLYGFKESTERELFMILIKVNGVGPKLALTILSSMEAAQFAQCIADGDAAALVRMPGVGKKTAERLIVEMRDKLAQHWQAEPTPAAVSEPGESESLGQVINDAVSALVALGYKPQEAGRHVKQLAAPGATREELIRKALKQIG